MKSYYTQTVIGMALVLVTVTAAAVLGNSAAETAKARYSHEVSVARTRLEARATHRQALVELEQAIQPARKFSLAWHHVANFATKPSAEVIRSDIETIAQRQLGLVIDGAITPQPERYSFGGGSLPVQRVTLRASGKDLAGLLTWLGAVEEKYPFALIELCEFNSNVGGNTGLTIRLAQPLQDPASIGSAGPDAAEDVRSLPALITAARWSDYYPLGLKGAIAVGFQRNPLQPAIMPDFARVTVSHGGEDALAEKLESAVAGRLHSVVRGSVPIINVDGKLFRVGDELVIGTGREKPVIDVKTKLKQIGAQQLVFHVSGGTTDKPIECDVAYKLPTFFQAR